MLPAMIPIFSPLNPDPPDDPDEEPSNDEGEPLVPPEDPLADPLEDPLEDPFEVVLTTVVELEKLMLGVFVVELEPYMYDVVPEGGDEGSAHTTVTDSTRAWKWPPAAV